MNKPKFSKGKWRASERGAYTDFDGNSRVISNSDKRLVVVQHHGSDEDEANTRLVENAPELFKLLSEVANQAEEIEHDHYALAGHEYFDPRKWQKKSLALLTKIIGKEQPPGESVKEKDNG
jgi:hypothetical protein